MNIKKLFLILVLILIISSYNVEGMGFGGEKGEVTFEPGLEAEFTWLLITTANIVRDYSIHAYGDLAEYVIIENGNLLKGVSPRSNPEIHVSLKLPDEEPSPGMHIIDIVMMELPTPEEKQGIYALSGAIPRIHVNVLYEGKYLESELSVIDINIGETIKPIIEIHNYGKENINNLNVEFMLYDEADNKLKSSNSETIVLNSDTEDINVPMTISDSEEEKSRTQLIRDWLFDHKIRK